MYRTWVILRHTFMDAIVQPIYSILVLLGICILVIFGVLPFFTLGEDTVMFKSVGLDVIQILILVATLFATSKSIYDEIEDRSMLTLMSKPVSKWEVLLGKYLGISAAALLAVALLGTVLILATWLRIPRDYTMAASSIDDQAIKLLYDTRIMHVMGLLPNLLTCWMQISVLAAIGVALSTRFSLVVNLPAVIILYIAGNLTRFLVPIWSDAANAPLAHRPALKVLAQVLTTVLPYLENFDVRAAGISGKIALRGTAFASDPQAFSLGALWGAVGWGMLYGVCYIGLALLVGMMMFRNRELGGAEG